MLRTAAAASDEFEIDSSCFGVGKEDSESVRIPTQMVEEDLA